MINKKDALTTQTLFDASFSKSKRAISPVVATALLLVVAVVSVVGFQGWFTEFSSSMFVDIETQSSGQSSVSVEAIVGDKLYINSKSNVSITSLKINNIDCNINTSIKGLDNLNISSCMENVSGSANIIVVTNSGIFESYKYISGDSSTLSSPSTPVLDCSGLVGGDWIPVPALAPFTSSPFCVMKYEAKDDLSGNCATGDTTGCPNSSATSPPWTSINQTDAKIECESLNTGIGNYHLITNAEWMSIARNVEQQDNNWNSTSVGVGSLKQGNNGVDLPGVSYDGAGPEQSSDGANETGSFVLSNGEVIWDLSGNVFEWNNDTLNMHADFIDGSDTDGDWDTQTNATFRLNAGPSNPTWGESERMGYVYDSNVMTNGFIRGGGWSNGASAGAFALSLLPGPSSSVASLGLRCSYAP
jgi:flagellin-like protein